MINSIISVGLLLFIVGFLAALIRLPFWISYNPTKKAKQKADRGEL